ncbi:hypothetical protein [Zunongwangia sp.]|uniref:hypothetical protein n=1 Tax=Zunongwangia sp. TaxID=1965325 RepID=UPI003AA95C2C
MFFAIFSFVRPRFDKCFALGLLSLNICDIFFINYESELNYNCVVLFRTLGFILISYGFLPKLRNIKFNFVHSIVLLVVLGVSCYLIIELNKMLPSFSIAYLKNVLFYFYAIVINIVIAIAFYNNSIEGSRKSFYFLNAILWMLFSDLSYFVAYDLGFEKFYYIDRFFNIFGLGFLCLYAITPFAKIPNSL